MKICFLWTFIFVQTFVGKGTEEDLCMDWEENVNDARTSRKHALLPCQSQFCQTIFLEIAKIGSSYSRPERRKELRRDDWNANLKK